MTAMLMASSPLFPVIESIADVLPAIEGRDEFLVAKKDGYTVVDYVYQMPDTFGCLATATPEEYKIALLRRELRGIKFDAESGCLIARPYHKFFNVGEREETLPHAIDFSQDHVVLEKLDGSMVHPALVRGELTAMTRMGTTTVAKPALDFALTHGSIKYRNFFMDLLEDGLLPILEWCSRAQRIVIDYPEDMLVLTGIRDLNSGRYVPYKALHDYAAPYKAPVVRAYAGGSVKDIKNFLSEAKGLLGMEGWIVRFADGRMYKVKADDYVFRHKAKEHLVHEKDIVALIVGNTVDDVIASLPPEDATRLRSYVAAYETGMAEICGRIQRTVAYFHTVFGNDRKRFALEVGPTIRPIFRDAVFGAFRGEDPRQYMLRNIALHLGSGPRLDVVRPLWNGVRWSNFYDVGAAKDLLSDG